MFSYSVFANGPGHPGPQISYKMAAQARITAIIAGFSLWKKGQELQHYWKRKRNIKQKLEYKIRHRKKAKKDSKKNKTAKTGKKGKKSKEK